MLSWDRCENKTSYVKQIEQPIKHIFRNIPAYVRKDTLGNEDSKNVDIDDSKIKSIEFILKYSCFLTNKEVEKISVWCNNYNKKPQLQMRAVTNICFSEMLEKIRYKLELDCEVKKYFIPEMTRDL